MPSTCPSQTPLLQSSRARLRLEPECEFPKTGATSTCLWTELNKLGLPVICIDARHAKAALRMQINKSDRNDAVGIARIMQCGWYKEVRVKDLDSHITRRSKLAAASATIVL